MTRIGLALALLVVLLALGVCSVPFQGDVVRALAFAGCRGAPAAEYQELNTRTVLSVRVQECVARGTWHDHGEALARQDALTTMSEAIWSTHTPRFDTLFVAVYRIAEEPHRTRAHSEEFSREQLVARFGPRDPALDHAPTLVDGMAWRIIPMLAAGAALLLLRGLWLAVRDGRIVPVWLVGRP